MRSSRPATIERRWPSSSARVMTGAFSASKVSVKGQMRTFVPGSNTTDWPPSTSSSPTTQLFSPTFSRQSRPSSRRTRAWRRETSGLASTT